MMIHRHSARRVQRGAALAVGLIFTAVLTLLAVTAMNLSTAELMMAGNEQFRQRAFLAAEIGIEQALTTLADVPPGSPPLPGDVQAVPESPINGATGEATDSYATMVTYMGEDGSVPEFSGAKFVGFHYAIESTGTSVRNARSVNTQGAYLINYAGGQGSYGP